MADVFIAAMNENCINKVQAFDYPPHAEGEMPVEVVVIGAPGTQD